jgi:hypothetical protein
MITVNPGTETSLASLTDPNLSIGAIILSVNGRHAELNPQGACPLEEGSLVQFRTSDTLYLGEIESKDGSGPVRVLIEHSVDLERAAAIRRSWNVGS